MYDVITMGSATIDMFAMTKSKLIKILDSQGETDLLAFSTGTKLLIDELHYSLGGGGTNTAAVFATFGLRTAFLGKVGTGFKSEQVLKRLRGLNVDTRLVFHGKEHTGVSIILDNIERDRVILAHKGVNNNLRMRDFKLSDIETRWIYASSLVGESYETLKKVARHAKKSKIKVAFNPSSYMTEKGIAYLRPVLKNIDVLIFNMHEATLLTKEQKLPEIFRKIHKTGPGIVVITDGKKGVHASDGANSYFVPAKKVKVVDSTGAGDSFAASFISGLMKDKDIPWSMKVGIENASAIIKVIGAKNGLLSWHEACRRANNNKSPVQKSVLY